HCDSHVSSYGDFGYNHVAESIATRLRRLGVPEDTLEVMLDGNVLRLLVWYMLPPPPLTPPREFAECSWCGGRFESKGSTSRSSSGSIARRSACADTGRLALRR
ncbi:unnamed protein product, partial [Phaeothamnion confervicola]